MTSRPRLHTSGKQLVGLVAFVLFGVLVAVFLTADFGTAETFAGAEDITAAIGYSLFDLDAGSIPAEGFLVSFLLIAVVLDAALDATVMLATRDEDEPDETAVADGGREGGDR
jgi:NADH-quinone oxidoreductase subunit J